MRDGWMTGIRGTKEVVGNVKIRDGCNNGT
jgi:hypothetical protein